jgi:hypothetical protein
MTRGSSVMEALAATVLAGLALGALAAVAALSTRSLRLARDTGTALALAAERLETLRAGQPGDGEDDRVAPDGTAFHRRWQRAGGRGTPHLLRARVEWPGHAVELASEAAP